MSVCEEGCECVCVCVKEEVSVCEGGCVCVNGTTFVLGWDIELFFCVR